MVEARSKLQDDEVEDQELSSIISDSDGSDSDGNDIVDDVETPFNFKPLKRSRDIESSDDEAASPKKKMVKKPTIDLTKKVTPGEPQKPVAKQMKKTAKKVGKKMNVIEETPDQDVDDQVLTPTTPAKNPRKSPVVKAPPRPKLTATRKKPIPTRKVSASSTDGETVHTPDDAVYGEVGGPLSTEPPRAATPGPSSAQVAIGMAPPGRPSSRTQQVNLISYPEELKVPVLSHCICAFISHTCCKCLIKFDDAGINYSCKYENSAFCNLFGDCADPNDCYPITTNTSIDPESGRLMPVDFPEYTIMSNAMTTPSTPERALSPLSNTTALSVSLLADGSSPASPLPFNRLEWPMRPLSALSNTSVLSVSLLADDSPRASPLPYNHFEWPICNDCSLINQICMHYPPFLGEEENQDLASTSSPSVATANPPAETPLPPNPESPPAFNSESQDIFNESWDFCDIYKRLNRICDHYS